MIKGLQAPQNPDEIIPEFTADVHRAYGDDLVSVILYGSGARGEYIKGRSDINFLICLRDASSKALIKGGKVAARWRRRRVATPLVVTQAEIPKLTEAFPLEFLTIQGHHRVVWGSDPLDGIVIDKQRLRQQLAHEAKAKLIQLRGCYLATKGWGYYLIPLATHSLAALLAIFEGILYLKGKLPPTAPGELIKAAASATGISAQPFMRILAVKQGMERRPARVVKVTMDGYIDSLQRLVAWIDGI